MKLSRSIKVVAATAVALASLSAPSAFAGETITGTGASFVTPLISTCKMAWQSSTDNTISYSGGGSGAGRANTDNGIGDLNFSDASYTPASDSVLQIPAVAAPIAISYNKKGIDGQLYLSPKTLSDIFAGKITKWNDAAIKADNAGKAASITYKKDKKGKVVKVNGKPELQVRLSLLQQVQLIFQTKQSALFTVQTLQVQHRTSLTSSSRSTHLFGQRNLQEHLALYIQSQILLFHG